MEPPFLVPHKTTLLKAPEQVLGFFFVPPQLFEICWSKGWAGSQGTKPFQLACVAFFSPLRPSPVPRRHIKRKYDDPLLEGLFLCHSFVCLEHGS